MAEKSVVVEVPKGELDAMIDKAVLQGGGISSALFMLAYGLMWLRRRLSHDGVEIKKEKSEAQLMDIVIKERNSAMDDAREAWAKRASDAELIGKLTANVEGLKLLNHKTNNEVQLLRLLNEKQSLEMNTLRSDIRSIREQMQTCISCPLRSVGEHRLTRGVEDEIHTKRAELKELERGASRSGQGGEAGNQEDRG